jgi:Domain of unknown function (DUF6471)
MNTGLCVGCAVLFSKHTQFGTKAIGIRETAANLRNKISWGGFTGAFLVQ